MTLSLIYISFVNIIYLALKAWAIYYAHSELFTNENYFETVG